MATNFPTGVDSFPRPGAGNNLGDTGFELDLLIDNLSDAVEAVETSLLTDVTVPNVRPSTIYLPPPGFVVTARDIPIATSNNTARYYPMRLETAWAINAVAVNVSALAAGSTIHVALYDDPLNNLQPGTRISAVSGAGFSGSTTGAKEATGLGLNLAAGNYVWVVTVTGGAPTLLGHLVATPFLGSLVNNEITNRFERSSATVPPPSTGEPWIGIGLGNALFGSVLWLKGA